MLCTLLLLQAAPVQAQVYRCGSTYSNTPCKNARPVDISEPLSDPAGPRTIEIYLCRAPNAGLYWANEHCHNRGWTVERMERVAKNISWDDQVTAAKAQRDAAIATATPAPITHTAPARPAPAPRNAACQALYERVAMLDSMGRAGSSYYDLDWIRRERKSARDEQFRLRC